jgi:hypothetical protein
MAEHAQLAALVQQVQHHARCALLVRQTWTVIHRLLATLVVQARTPIQVPPHAPHVHADTGAAGLADLDSDPSTPCETAASPDVCPPRPCPADFNRSGFINTDDLLLLLAAFGRNSCEFDVAVPFDGYVATPDLLALLAVFGRSC